MLAVDPLPAGMDPAAVPLFRDTSMGWQMGRWSSDIYHLYVRACFERCCEWTRKAGSTVVTDVARTVDEVHYY